MKKKYFCCFFVLGKVLLSCIISFVILLFGGCLRTTDSSFGRKPYDEALPQPIFEENVSYDFFRPKLDICYPDAEKGELYPLIVYIHGGAWSSGTKSEIKEWMPSFCMKGYVVASVEYTFSDREPFPAQLRDIRNAITFLVDNRDRYHINSDSIGLWGISAGAHLALITANADEIKTDGWEDNFKIAAVSDWSGPTDLTLSIGAFYAVEMLLGKTPGEGIDDDMLRYISPTAYISEKSPPTQILQGRLDDIVFPEHAERLADLLEQKGDEYELHFFENKGHTFDDEGQQALDLMLAFFDKHLKS